MREVKIDGLDKPVKVRSIKRNEQVGGLDEYGYHLLFYSPPTKPDGTIDREKTEKGMDMVIDALIGPETAKAIDDTDGGSKALHRVWLEIIKETYGDKDEEKNSSPAGNGTPTPSGLPTAKAAEEAVKSV